MSPPDEVSRSDLAARLTNVDLNLLPALLALLQESGVTAAGDQVGLSQPAMSHALSRLRLLLGDELLVRSGNRSFLTPRAKALQDVVANVLAQVSDLVLRPPGNDRPRDRRRLTLATTPSIAFVVAPVLLEEIAADAPNLSLKFVDNADSGRDVFGNPEVDVVLLPEAADTSYGRTRLFSDRWAAVVAAENQEVGEQLTIDKLLALPHLAYQDPASHVHAYSAFAAAGLTPEFDLETTNFLLMPPLIVGTRRLAIVQTRVATRLADFLPVRVLDLPLEVPPFNVDLVLNPRRAADPASEWLVEALRKRIAAFAR